MKCFAILNIEDCFFPFLAVNEIGEPLVYTTREEAENEVQLECETVIEYESIDEDLLTTVGKADKGIDIEKCTNTNDMFGKLQIL